LTAVRCSDDDAHDSANFMVCRNCRFGTSPHFGNGVCGCEFMVVGSRRRPCRRVCRC
jgi:hypothetical protein